jgi:hypothetical protein
MFFAPVFFAIFCQANQSAFILRCPTPAEWELRCSPSLTYETLSKTFPKASMEDSSTGCARVLYKGPSPAFHSTLSLAQLQAGFKTRSPFASSITRQTKPTRG